MFASIRRSPVLPLLLSFLALASCGGSSPTQPARDWIELKSIQPAEGSTFAAGEQVTFTATVDCTIATSDGGMVSLVVQGPDVLNQPTPTSLSKGTKTVTLTTTATMPGSGVTVTAFIPLFVNESNTTAMMKRVSYSVR